MTIIKIQARPPCSVLIRGKYAIYMSGKLGQGRGGGGGDDTGQK